MLIYKKMSKQSKSKINKKRTTMKKNLLLVLLLMGLLLAACSGEQNTSTPEPVSEDPTEAVEKGDSELPAELTAQLDSFLQSQIYTDGGNPVSSAPGIVLLVDTPEGRYLNAAGVANLEDGPLMKVDDRLQIGSNSKSFTIVLLMQLQEEGILSMDDPLSKWLPEYASSLPNGDLITLRQMANHTAGLWDYANGVIGGGAGDPALLEKSYSPEELVQFAVDNGTALFAPGEEGQWEYSNTGYILMGMIAEKATGESLKDLYQQRIFDPLEMDSAVLIEGVPQGDEITAHGYYWQDGEVLDTTNWNASQGWSAGALAMTAADLATYGHALAAGELFENPDSLTEMTTWVPYAAMNLGPYGLGLLDVIGDGTVWGHGGETLGFQSLWYTNPEKGILVVGLTNSASYSANNIINVQNIIDGDGAQPITGFSLLPVGDFVPTSWVWTQYVNPEGITEISDDEESIFKMNISKDKSVAILSAECGLAIGSYTINGSNITFDLDDSKITCDEDSLGGRGLQYIKSATSWHFDNGGLVIELPAEGEYLRFEMP
jgi:D-alanyl-D-alanine carboxypeptidase